MRAAAGLRGGASDRSAGEGTPEGGREFAWGFLAQVFSSATNFGVALAAGRLLGPSGLGLVVIGLGAYLLVTGLQRAFVAQPIVAHAAPLPAVERRTLAEAGLTIVLGTSAFATIALAVTGVGVGGSLGRAMLIVAPWIVAATLQDYWKAVLFQETLGAAGVASEGARFFAMCGFTLAAVYWRHDYAIVGAWGMAATVGLIVAIWCFPMRPGAPRVSIALWRQHVLDLGLWLGGREVAFQAIMYAMTISLALVLGTSDLGGLRSAEALFSPWSLIAAAVVLPALPALSRAAARSHGEANRLALKISLGATGLGLAYFVVMVLIGPWLLTLAFGSEFASYDDLVWPMGVTQLLLAATYSFNLLLPAERRGSAFFAAGVVLASSTFACAIGFALRYGVTGAAWGIAAGAGIGSVFVVWLSLRERGSHNSIGTGVPDAGPPANDG